MADNETMPQTKVNKEFKSELAALAGWTNTSGIQNKSFLYKVDSPRTSPTARPAHFGFIKGHGTVSGAADTVGRTLTGPLILVGKPVLTWRDLELPTFGDMSARVHLKLNGHMERIFGTMVLYSVFRAIGRELTIFDPVPEWEGDVAYQKFVAELATHVAAAFPSRPAPALDLVVVEQLSAKKTMDQIRDTILTTVVKLALAERQFEPKET